MRCCPKCSRPGPVSAFGEVRFFLENLVMSESVKNQGRFVCQTGEKTSETVMMLQIWDEFERIFTQYIQMEPRYTFQQPFSKCCNWPWFHPKNCSTTGTKMKQLREGCWFKPTKSKRPWVFAQKHRRFFCIFQGWNIVFTWMQPPTRWSPELTLRRETVKTEFGMHLGNDSKYPPGTWNIQL